MNQQTVFFCSNTSQISHCLRINFCSRFRFLFRFIHSSISRTINNGVNLMFFYKMFDSRTICNIQVCNICIKNFI